MLNQQMCLFFFKNIYFLIGSKYQLVGNFWMNVGCGLLYGWLSHWAHFQISKFSTAHYPVKVCNSANNRISISSHQQIFHS
jgi:hypothetical protein